MRVLVCGGRDFSDQVLLFHLLDQVHALKAISCIIQGNARGADILAKKWAESRGVSHDDFPADWSNNGKAAGHIRNQQMLVSGVPDKVIAFPGGRGTADMIRRARKAKLPVYEVKG